MPRLPWDEFVRKHLSPHLVIAVLPESEEIGTLQARGKRDVLVSTIRLLAPSDDYATTIVRTGGRAEIHCAFANSADAIAFATAMAAQVAARRPSCASRRVFRFDDEAALALRAALPPSPLGESQRRRRDKERPIPQTGATRA
jgi:hypothetical protein